MKSLLSSDLIERPSAALAVIAAVAVLVGAAYGAETSTATSSTNGASGLAAPTNSIRAVSVTNATAAVGTNSLAGTGRKQGSVVQTNTVAVVDEFSYGAFKIINDRNIFSPSRTRSSSREENRERPKKAKVDKFALVGTMIYYKGTFAFFDGSESSYRKSVKLGEKVAGFEVKAITQDGAKIQVGTNTISLKVGAGMQREEEGEWQQTSSPGGFEVASSKGDKSEKSESSSSDSGGGGESDILKRLLEKREKELKNEK